MAEHACNPSNGETEMGPSLLGELYFYDKYPLHGYSVVFEENNQNASLKKNTKTNWKAVAVIINTMLKASS